MTLAQPLPWSTAGTIHFLLNTIQVHRHTHRIVRGCLLAIGRPDGRLNALTSAEAAINLTVYQSTSIQNYRATCETITIGHSPYKLPLSKCCLTLPGKRPKFFCEAECDARFGSEALDGISPGGLMSTMATLLAATTSAALSNIKSRKTMIRKMSYQEMFTLVSKKKCIEKIEQPFMGSWMQLSQPVDTSSTGGSFSGGSFSNPAVGQNRTVGDLMERQRFLQVTPKRNGHTLPSTPCCSKLHRQASA